MAESALTVLTRDEQLRLFKRACELLGAPEVLHRTILGLPASQIRSDIAPEEIDESHRRRIDTLIDIVSQIYLLSDDARRFALQWPVPTLKTPLIEVIQSGNEDDINVALRALEDLTGGRI